jgi:hypothetical protein
MIQTAKNCDSTKRARVELDNGKSYASAKEAYRDGFIPEKALCLMLYLNGVTQESAEAMSGIEFLRAVKRAMDQWVAVWQAA